MKSITQGTTLGDIVDEMIEGDAALTVNTIHTDAGAVTILVALGELGVVFRGIARQMGQAAMADGTGLLVEGRFDGVGNQITDS